MLLICEHLFNLCHLCADCDGTQITLMVLICTDSICEYLFDLCHLCSIMLANEKRFTNLILPPHPLV